MVKIRYKIMTCILAVLTLFACFTTVSFVANANDNTVEYTDVLVDLQKDENFKINEFPAVAKDNKLYVIQIAESVNKELFVYVYQPSARARKLVASEIRLSRPEVGKDSVYKDYKLTLLNQNGVFQKYKVENLTLKQTSVRYYEIVQITRPFDGTIDTAPTNGNTVKDVPFEVSQTWEIMTVNKQTSYKMLTLETITITDKFVGFIRYDEGFKLYIDKCDSHFVAFNTDRNMEKLLEASITYVAQDYFYIQDGLFVSGEEFGKAITIPLELNHEQEASNDGDGLFAKKYRWKRIEKVQEFLNNEDAEDMTLTKEGSTELNKMKWVLRFAETPYLMDILYDTDWQGNLYQSGYMYNQTHVSDVTILRLKFETDGETYNLGVVDNKQTGSTEPVGTVKPNLKKSIIEILKKFLTVILFILLLVVVGVLVITFAPWIISLLGKLLLFIIKAVVWLLVFPFNLIGKLFKKKDKGK